MGRLIEHVQLRPNDITRIPLGQLFTYVYARDGVYIQAQRDLLAVRFKIADADLRDLREVEPAFVWMAPPIPADLAHDLVDRSENLAERELENLFHLCHSAVYPYNDGWEIVEPDQIRTSRSCRPLDPETPSAQRAIIEIHSHHKMPAFFSPDDNADEKGFRLYGVIGGLGAPRPQIRMRVGVYGYFWEIPASYVMDLPPGLRDVNALESEGDQEDEETVLVF